MFKTSLCLAVTACFALVIAGCGGGAANVGAVKVTGTVTLDGSPVEGATVTFAPKGDEGRVATGLTDASGNFSLTTIEAGDGAIPGSYNVLVSKTTGAAAGQSASQEEAMAKMQEEMASGHPMSQKTETKNELPAKYSSVAESGLTAEVGPSGGTFTFELKNE